MVKRLKLALTTSILIVVLNFYAFAIDITDEEWEKVQINMRKIDDLIELQYEVDRLKDLADINGKGLLYDKFNLLLRLRTFQF